MDKRQQKTRQLIEQTFAQLMRQKDYQCISVSEIITTANIARSTFYAHFTAKDDLLMSRCTNLFSHVIDSAFAQPCQLEKNFNYSDFESIITHIFYHLREHRYELIGFLCQAENKIITTVFYQAASKMAGEIFTKIEPIQTTFLPKKFLVHHFASSLIATCKWWADTNFKHSPELMATYFTAIIKPLLK